MDDRRIHTSLSATNACASIVRVRAEGLRRRWEWHHEPSTVSVTAALMRSLRALALRAHLYVFVCPKLGRSSMLHAAWRAPVNRIKVDRLAEPLGCGADGGRHACNLREEVRHVRALRSHPVLDLIQEAEAVGCGLDVQDEGAHVAWVQVAQVGKLWGTNARRMHHDCGRSERCNFAP